MSGDVVAWVFARGGSKGLPGKNLSTVGGTSLLAHAIASGRAAVGPDNVFVSTDDAAIAAAAREAGAIVPFVRPARLAGDDAPEWLAWRHAVEFMRDDLGRRPDAMLILPATAPLRGIEDVEACLAALEPGTDIVITVSPARRNPYYNMVTIAPSGAVELVIPPVTTIPGRQQAPDVFDMTTVAYAVDPAFVLRAESWRDGVVRAVIVPPERAIDIDDEMDLLVAECLWELRA